MVSQYDHRRRLVTIGELIDGYEDRGQDGIEGVVAYGSRTDRKTTLLFRSYPPVLNL